MNEFGTSSLVVLKGLEGNELIHLGVIQTFIRAHIDQGIDLWWGIFFSTLFTASIILFRDVIRTR